MLFTLRPGITGTAVDPHDRRLYSVLRPGGRLLITDYCKAGELGFAWGLLDESPQRCRSATLC